MHVCFCCVRISFSVLSQEIGWEERVLNERVEGHVEVWYRGPEILQVLFWVLPKTSILKPDPH